MTTSVRLSGTKCDFCFLCAPINEVHRSLCKTKNYCSKSCRKADDNVHKVCCKKEGGHPVEERKVKTGGQEKVEVANSNLKGFATAAGACLEAASDRPKSREANEMTRHCSKLVEKIQLREEQKLKEAQEPEVNEVD